MSATAERIAELPQAAAVLDRVPGENFPVASRLLARRERGHLLALYGYARLVDDAGDEAPGDRMALLDAIEAELDRIYAGVAARHPLTRRLAATIASCDLPRGPLQALIAANRRDQVVHRYATFDELLAYCELSASPVGRVVLCVLGAATPERIALSDRGRPARRPRRSADPRPSRRRRSGGPRASAPRGEPGGHPRRRRPPRVPAALRSCRRRG